MTKIKNLKFKIFLGLCFVFLFGSQAFAQKVIISQNYRITLPNLNMGGGIITSPGGSKIGVTTGQTAPGVYTSAGYKVRAGFWYLKSIIPFSFSLSDTALEFGVLTPNTLTNEKSLTLTVNSGSAGGYQITIQENDPLTSGSLATIPDTTCDTSDPCTHTDAGTWQQTTTYGFGYTMSGTDVPEEFLGGKFKNFPDYPLESPVKIMGKTIAEGHEAEKNKIATLSARINISPTQEAGTYQNILTFIATPTY